MLKQIILLAASSVITLASMFGGAPQSVNTAHHVSMNRTAPTHQVTVEKVQQVKEVVITVQRAKGHVAAPKKEEIKKEVKCQVRELSQGFGLVRICS